MVANGARIARIVKDFMQKKKSKIILSRSSKLACLIRMVKKMNTFVVKNDTNPKNRMSSFNDRRENFIRVTLAMHEIKMSTFSNCA